MATRTQKPGLRIAVVGTSGSGKTVLSARLAALLGLQHVELDELNFEPSWQQVHPDEFRSRVEKRLQADRWIADGNYSRVKDVVWKQADTLVWLDYALPVVLSRLFFRTCKRLVTREKLWHGNVESFRAQFFSRDSIFLWAITTYARNRQRYAEWITQPENEHLKVIKLDSPEAAAQWLKELSAQ